MILFELALIIAAGFACGALNAIAGGGTFITLPVLIWIGVPPVTANATATTMALPGYIASAWAYRKDIETGGVLSLKTIMVLAATGGVLGALLLIFTSPDAFLALVPWLLLTATLLFAFAPKIQAASKTSMALTASPMIAAALLLIVATYGGYFNGGLGIIVLATLSLLGYRNIHGMNGVKTLISCILSSLSVITFIGADLIDWNAAIPMALANLCGAYITSRFVRQIKCTDWLRFGIIAIGLAMTIAFFVAP